MHGARVEESRATALPSGYRLSPPKNPRLSTHCTGAVRPVRRLIARAQVRKAILAALLQHLPHIPTDGLARSRECNVLVDELQRVIFWRSDDDGVDLAVLEFQPRLAAVQEAHAPGILRLGFRRACHGHKLLLPASAAAALCRRYHQ